METPNNIIELNTQTDKIRVMLDASALKEASCLRRLKYNIIDGYRSSQGSASMDYGTAVHAFIADMKLNGGVNYKQAIDLAKAIQAKAPLALGKGKQYLNDPTHLVTVCMMFWEKYYGSMSEKTFETVLNPVDKKPLVELKFAVPYYTDDKVEVLLAGTMDDICYQQGGCYAVRDYKTTSVWNSAEYLSSYILNPQLMFYRYVIQIYAQLYPQTIFGEINKKPVGCFIDGIFIKPNAVETKFERSEVFFYKQQQMNEFVRGLDQTVATIVEIVKGNFKTIRNGMITGGCETVYGKCKYFGVCSATDEIAAGHILKRNFIQKTYNPLDFNA